MRLSSFHHLCVLILTLVAIEGANWAQVSGPIKQNVVLTEAPSVDSKYYSGGGHHWGPRFGMAVTTHQIGSNSFGSIFLMGGDCYDKDFEKDRSSQEGIKRSHAYQNDVWSTEGVSWFTMGDVKETNGVKVYIRYPSMKYKRQRMPRTKSKLVWVQEFQSGVGPEPGKSYQDWIMCNLPETQRSAKFYDADSCEQGMNTNAMWSPRRHHAAISFSTKTISEDASCSLTTNLFVLGGRAREFVDLQSSEMRGGVTGPVTRDRFYTQREVKTRSAREATILKNDVWKSTDGVAWNLVTPGCRMNEASYLVNGLDVHQCETNDECYGAEVCDGKKCVCAMWSPREQHTVGTFRDQMYVVGGYASQLYALSQCGEFDCGDALDGSSYRWYLNDLWQSTDGLSWKQVDIPDFERYSGRGGHAMLLYPDSNGRWYIWLFGGRGGDNYGNSLELYYYKDIWRYEIDKPRIIVAGDAQDGSAVLQSILPDEEGLDDSYSFDSADGKVTDFAFSPDPNDGIGIFDKFLVTVTDRGEALSWNLEGTPNRLDNSISGRNYFWVQSEPMYSVSFALFPDDTPNSVGPTPTIVTGHADGIVRLWFPNENNAAQTVQKVTGDTGGNGNVVTVAASLCAGVIAGGSANKVRVWEMKHSAINSQFSLAVVNTFSLSGEVRSIAFNVIDDTNGHSLYLAVSDDLAIGVYQQKENIFTKIKDFSHQGTSGDYVNALAFAPRGLTMGQSNVLLLSGGTNDAKLWDAISGERKATFSADIPNGKEVTSVSFSPQGASGGSSPITVVIGLSDGTVLSYSTNKADSPDKIFGGDGKSNVTERSLARVVAFKPNTGFLAQAAWVDTSSINGSAPVAWDGRAGHTVNMEETPLGRQLVLVGGETKPQPGATARVFSEEVWTLRPDDDNVWLRDYDEMAWYKAKPKSIGSGNSPPVDIYYQNSPSVNYVTPDSPLSQMKRFVLPDKTSRIPNQGFKPYTKYDYITDESISQLESLGINTIRDLAEADKYKILKLRGYDVPQVPEEERMTYYDVCDARELAKAIVEMCTVTSRYFYAGEMQMPWNIDNVFNGIAPVKGEPEDEVVAPGLPQEWHGRDFADYFPMVEYDELVENWDGCSELALPELAKPTAFNNYPNVNGLGWVTVPDSIADPLKTLQELQCRWNPGPRAYHSSVNFPCGYSSSCTYVLGGKGSEDSFNGDTWYRDDRLPRATFKIKEPDWYVSAYEHIFLFQEDEPGVSFEYRVWFPEEYKELLGWTPVTYKADVSWLDWRAGGPGDNYYMLFVRAVDPAGNRDEKYILDRDNGNLHYWQYISPTAWDLIGEGVGGFLALSLFGYLEYRRRKKKAAMERYAMKRMRRKFKAMQRDEEGGIVDWRTLYNENKTQDAAKRKSKKQEREEKKRQREKEKKKRDKEKENIKKKLKAGKDHKDKQKKALEKQEEKKALKSEEKKKKKKKKDKGGAIEDGDRDAGDVKKLKDYEKGDAGDVKKLKDYEKGNVPSGDPAEQGTKQRKSNKRYKDYEMDQEGTGKKDI